MKDFIIYFSFLNFIKHFLNVNKNLNKLFVAGLEHAPLGNHPSGLAVGARWRRCCSVTQHKLRRKVENAVP